MNLTFPLGRAVYKTVDSVGPTALAFSGGTAPTGTPVQTCKAQYVGNGFITVEIKVTYPTAGIANTAGGFDWPADLPSPKYMTGVTGAQAITGSGLVWLYTETAWTGVTPVLATVTIKRNGPDSAWTGNFGVFTAVGIKYAIIQMTVQVA